MKKLVETPGVGLLYSRNPYRGTSRIRNSALLGPYSKTMHRVLGGGRVPLSEVPLYKKLVERPGVGLMYSPNPKPLQGYLAQKNQHPPRTLHA